MGERRSKCSVQLLQINFLQLIPGKRTKNQGAVAANGACPEQLLLRRRVTTGMREGCMVKEVVIWYGLEPGR